MTYCLVHIFLVSTIYELSNFVLADNVMIMPGSFQAKLIDLDFVKREDYKQWSGTHGFIAPEVILLMSIRSQQHEVLVDSENKYVRF